MTPDLAADLATRTPTQIDTEIARIEAEIAAQRDIRDRARRVLDPNSDRHSVIARNRARCSLELAELALRLRCAELQPYLDEYARRGWNRFYLVNSYDGHVHRDASPYRCSRTASTQHGWLLGESGKTYEEVVELAGDRVCSVCFPWAPVNTLKRPSAFTPPVAAAKEARRVERAAAKAAKAEKAITNPDGTPLRIIEHGYLETLATVRAAEIRVVDIAFYERLYGTRHPHDEANTKSILEALAAKKGTTVVEEGAAMEKRLRARCKRERVDY